MNIFNRIRTAIATLSVAALLIPGLLIATVSPAMAHETPCPYCGMKVVQDTKTEDNEVVLRYGNKRIEYRCVLCAIAEAKSRFKGDVTITAPSNVKGKPVIISRKAGDWTANPTTALFVYAKGSHKECEVRYRAVANKEAFDAFVKANPKVLEGAKAVSLKEMVELSK